jgi:hypothetical protein
MYLIQEHLWPGLVFEYRSRQAAAWERLLRGDDEGAVGLFADAYRVLLDAQPPQHRYHKGEALHNLGLAHLWAGNTVDGLSETLAAPGTNATADGPGVFFGGSGGAAVPAADFMGIFNAAGTEANSGQILIPVSGTLKNFAGNFTAVTGGTGTFILRKNGADTALTDHMQSDPGGNRAGDLHRHDPQGDGRSRRLDRRSVHPHRHKQRHWDVVGDVHAMTAAPRLSS